MFLKIINTQLKKKLNGSQKKENVTFFRKDYNITTVNSKWYNYQSKKGMILILPRRRWRVG